MTVSCVVRDLLVATAASETPAEEPASAFNAEDRASEIAEVAEEIRFYLEHFMRDQAQAAFARLKSLTNDRSIIDAVALQIEAAGSKATSEPEPEVAEVAEISEDESHEFEVEVESASTSEIEIPQEPLEGFNHAVPAHQEHAVEEPIVEPEPVA